MLQLCTVLKCLLIVVVRCTTDRSTIDWSFCATVQFRACIFTWCKKYRCWGKHVSDCFL